VRKLIGDCSPKEWGGTMMLQGMSGYKEKRWQKYLYGQHKKKTVSGRVEGCGEIKSKQKNAC